MREMEQNAELRLPTIAVPVKLAVVGGAPIAAELFVPDTIRTGRTQLLEDLAATLVTDAITTCHTFGLGWTSRE